MHSGHAQTETLSRAEIAGAETERQTRGVRRTCTGHVRRHFPPLLPAPAGTDNNYYNSAYSLPSSTCRGRSRPINDDEALGRAQAAGARPELSHHPNGEPALCWRSDARERRELSVCLSGKVCHSPAAGRLRRNGRAPSSPPLNGPADCAPRPQRKFFTPTTSSSTRAPRSSALLVCRAAGDSIALPCCLSFASGARGACVQASPAALPWPWPLS